MSSILAKFARSIPLPIGPYWYLVAYRWLLVATGFYTILITWNVWQVRTAPGWEPWSFAMPDFHSTWIDQPSPAELAPMLPLWDWLPQFHVGWLLLGSLALVLVHAWAGIIAYTVILAIGMALDATRIQPPCLISLLLIGTIPNINAQMLGRAYLISMWFWVGFHKLIADFTKPDWARGFRTDILPEDVGRNLERWKAVFPENWLQWDVFAVGNVLGWIIICSEVGLAVLCLIPKTRIFAGIFALVMHLGIAVWHCHSYTSSVLAWNIALAFAGLALIAPWRESILESLKQCRRAIALCAVLLFVYPAGFYVNAVAAYFAHCVYVPNTPYAELRRPGEETKFAPWLCYEVVNFPLSPGQSISQRYFDKIKRPGDSFIIYDPRPWARLRGTSMRQLTYDGEIREGLAYGHWIHRHRDGTKSHEGDYVKGKMHGPWTWWHYNGKLASQGSFVNDQKHGLWKRWHKNGNLESEGHYNHDKEEGLWTYWYPTGKKAMEGRYADGQPDGIWVTWTPEGQQESTIEFRKGEPVTSGATP